MESQMARPHGVHDHEHGPNNVGLHPEGEDEHRHEKKSVLKKVKDKAKKLKEKVKLHGHGHGHGQDEHHEVHVPDDHDLYEEDDDEDEEMVGDPEVHGASAYSSASLRSSAHGHGGRLGDPRTYYGGPTTMQEEHTDTDPIKSSVLGQEEDESAPPKVHLERTTAFKEVPHAPVNSPASISPADPVKGFVHEQERIRGQPEVNLEVPVGLEEDPHAPKDRLVDHAPSNYQTKVTDPTGSGGKEAGITPMLQSFDKMNICDDSKQGEKKKSSVRPRDAQPSMFPPGSHDQFSAEPTPPIYNNPKENPESGSESIDSLKIKEQPGGDIAEKPSYQSSNTGKTSSATSAIADTEKAATNVIASKLGYIQRDDNIQEHEVAHEGQNAAKPASSVEYGKKVAATVTEKLTPVYEKVVGLGSTVMSKVFGNTNTSTNTSNEADNMIKGKDKGVSVKDYFVEKLSPGEEDRALSEVISETLNKGKAEAVTESEEVKRRLESSSTEECSGERVDSGSVHIPDKTVVDKLKGTVGSLFVKGEGSRASQQRPLSFSNAVTQSLSSTYASGEEIGDRRLQESGN
ncbi:hypothetical protein POTOM_049917 [Populus tomentosa]|uniref:Low-temperature-induced 65 kDa protein n=1 Tax=Populus tomentosa TaxID=118781 RepID=A0A8X7YER9_POPTO|nr:hypothetical protein POTOM_049917 [Populus tomentosa]